MDIVDLDCINDEIRIRTSANLIKFKDSWLLAQGLSPRMNYKELTKLISEKTGKNFREVTLTQYFRGSRFNLGFVFLMAELMDISPLRILLTEEDLNAEATRMLKDFTDNVEKSLILDEFKPIMDFYDRKRLQMTIRKDFLSAFAVDSKAEIYGLVLESHVNHTSHRDGALALVDTTNRQVTRGTVLVQSSQHWIVCDVVLNSDFSTFFKFNDGTTVPFDPERVKGRIFHVFS